MKKRVIIFAPHPDDESLGCGGTIPKKIKQEYEVSIVFMTDGRHAYSKLFDILSEPSPEELKEIRIEEAKIAAKILDVKEKNLIFLNFEDGILWKYRNKAQGEIIKILKRKTPIEVYYPHLHEYHIDHMATNVIISNSIKYLGINPLKYQYIIDMNRFKFIKENIIGFLKGKSITEDISSFLKLKKLAIKAYKSQIMILSDKQKKPVLDSKFLKKFLKNTEKFIKDI